MALPLRRLALGLLTLVLLVPAQLARAQGRQFGTVNAATVVLDDITARNKKGLPPLILRHATAVAIIPNMVKGGFIIGGRHGRGVVLVRGLDGAWSFPIFIQIGGGSFGFQAGLQSTDLVLVFKNRETIDSFLQGKGKLMLGVDGSLALGGLGTYGTVGTGAALKSQYVAFSRNRGLFAGVAVDGAAMSIDVDSNTVFYGRTVSPAQIMGRNGLVVPEPGVTLQALLMAKTNLVPLDRGIPGGAVVVEEISSGPPIRIDEIPTIIDDIPAEPSTTIEVRPSTPSQVPPPAATRSQTPPARPPLDEEPMLDLEPLPPPAEAVPTRTPPSATTPPPSNVNSQLAAALRAAGDSDGPAASSNALSLRGFNPVNKPRPTTTVSNAAGDSKTARLPLTPAVYERPAAATPDDVLPCSDPSMPVTSSTWRRATPLESTTR